MTRRVLSHPRVRYLGGGMYEFIGARHGEADFRIVSDRGYVSKSVTEEAARHFAYRFTTNRAGETFRVQSRIVGVTSWTDAAEQGPCTCSVCMAADRDRAATPHPDSREEGA